MECDKNWGVIEMRHWKSKKKTEHGIWVSEIRLKTVGLRRLGKVKKLIALLEKEGFDETVS